MWETCMLPDSARMKINNFILLWCRILKSIFPLNIYIWLFWLSPDFWKTDSIKKNQINKSSFSLAHGQPNRWNLWSIGHLKRHDCISRQGEIFCLLQFGLWNHYWENVLVFPPIDLRDMTAERSIHHPRFTRISTNFTSDLKRSNALRRKGVDGNNDCGEHKQQKTWGQVLNL